MEDNNQQNIDTNPFFSRGCCAVPDAQSGESSYSPSCAKLNSFDWLKDIDLTPNERRLDIIEVRFKNSKKDFFRVVYGNTYNEGDIVAVESSPGHDLGIVCLIGEAVRLQMKKKKCRQKPDDLKKVYRRARATDIEKWVSAVEKENETLFGTRTAASDLGLAMKINDVEYQGDGTKAVFYYTAEDRVDFRELIKVLAERFKIRVEMRQIGARQEAARMGGIGSCGREVCCATWMTNFSSVTTNNARTQQLSLNPSKLAGQCGKLKCCLNYENDAYLEALSQFPDSDVILKSKQGDAVYQKADVFKKIIWYSYKDNFSSMMALPLKEVKKVIELNKKGKIPDKLEDFAQTLEQKTDYEAEQEQDDFYRFDDDVIY